MDERPILFSGPMVQPILADMKLMTRRVVKRTALEWLESGFSPEFVASPMNRLSPYGYAGDRLWVREAWAEWGRDDQCGEGPSITREPIYRADNYPFDAQGKWRPSIHMPRAASRITLEVTAVRIEPLQEITRGDAMAEGCPFPNMAQGADPREWFSDLWVQINGAGSWERNPWVWVVEFKRLPS